VGLDSPKLEAWAVQALIPEDPVDPVALGHLFAGLYTVFQLLPWKAARHN
jgi:hypothetical protein